MRVFFLSAWVWSAIIFLTLLSFPLMLCMRLIDRDPTKYRSGRMLKRLGCLTTRINPKWKVTIAQEVQIDDPRNPYVFISNHQSIADIAILCCLPWEMKWVAKEELFRIPFLGWSMRLSKDISVNRKSRKSRASVFPRAQWMLERRCPVVLFPEGTRSLDGRVMFFNQGAFEIAIRAQVPIVPMVIEGSSDCIPKHSFLFRETQHVQLKMLRPIPTQGMTTDDVGELCERVRHLICQELAAMRGVDVREVDALAQDTGVTG